MFLFRLEFDGWPYNIDKNGNGKKGRILKRNTKENNNEGKMEMDTSELMKKHNPHASGASTAAHCR